MSLCINLFDANSVNEALKAIKDMERRIAERTELFQRRVAERIAQLSQDGFDKSIVSDVINGEVSKPDVNVSVDDYGDMCVVIANGEDAVFIEFGAGMHHNGEVGQSPNPLGAGLHFTIGSYGRGRGKQDIWAYKDGDETIWTHGTPATMPMYNAIMTVCEEIEDIAREVFG